MADQVKPGELLEHPTGQSAAKEDVEIFKKLDINQNYSVSNLGRVRNDKTNKFLSPRDLEGYKRVSIYVNGKATDLRIHRLVATAFIPNLNNKPQVNHINGNRSDNCVTNLEWCTNAENVKHAYKIGLKDSKSNSESARGTRNPNCKLSEQDVKDIKTKLEYLTGAELAKQYNVTPSTISNIKNNKKWKHLQSSTTIESYS